MNKPRKPRKQGPDLRCSFCGKPMKDVRKLLAGLDVHICNECVGLCVEIISEDGRLKGAGDGKPELRNLPPAEVKAFLDEHVVGQEQAKKVLSVAVYNHYKRISADNEDGIDLSKGNILMIGPTGSGKTYMAQTLARLLDVPSVIVDATCLTEAGYVGEDVENIIKNLWLAAGKDVEQAGRGIVCVDEIDKIAGRSQTANAARDVGGEGVQQALLKVVESEIVLVSPEGNRNRPQQDFVQVDTTNILFITCGAFDGLADIIERRVGQTQLGFGRTSTPRLREERVSELLHQVQGEDLIKFGLLPEFVGRFPVVVCFDPLDEDALVEVLWKPRNSLVKQYQCLLELDSVKLTLTQEALVEIAREAIRRKAGARGLRSIMEELMLDIMYELPDISGLSEVVLDDKVVQSKSGPKMVFERKPA